MGDDGGEEEEHPPPVTQRASECTMTSQVRVRFFRLKLNSDSKLTSPSTLTYARAQSSQPKYPKSPPGHVPSSALITLESQTAGRSREGHADCRLLKIVDEDRRGPFYPAAADTRRVTSVRPGSL
jgi:hypothetical protein